MVTLQRKEEIAVLSCRILLSLVDSYIVEEKPLPYSVNLIL